MKRSAKSSIKATVIAGLLSAISLAGSSSTSLAHGGTADEQAACTPDVLRLCFFEIPDEDRIVACLNRKLSELSPACHDVIARTPSKKKTYRKR